MFILSQLETWKTQIDILKLGSQIILMWPSSNEEWTHQNIPDSAVVKNFEVDKGAESVPQDNVG